MGKRNYKPWSDSEISTLKRRYPNTPTKKLVALLKRPIYSIYNKVFSLGLQKSTEYMERQHQTEARRLRKVGASHRFKPGSTPFNKGMKGWDAGGRSAKTRFKKGNKPQTWLPIGTERIDADGYRDRKVSDTGCKRRDWKGLHVILWEKHHGQVPPGHAIVFRDGNKKNIKLENLEMVSRAELMRRNTIHRYPPQLKQVIRLTRKLQRTIGQQPKRGSREKQDRRSA